MPAKAKKKSKKDELLEDLGDELTDARSGYVGGTAQIQAIYEETGQLIPPARPASLPGQTSAPSPKAPSTETTEGSMHASTLRCAPRRLTAETMATKELETPTVVAETLPEPDMSKRPKRCAPGTIEEFVWKQQERRRIFTQETAHLRKDWIQKRAAVLAVLAKQQKYLQQQLSHLEKVTTGRSAAMTELSELLISVEGKLEESRLAAGDPDASVAAIEDILVESQSSQSSPEAPSRHGSKDPLVPVDEAPLMAVSLPTGSEHDSEAHEGKNTYYCFANENASRTTCMGRCMSSNPVEAICLSVILSHAIIMGVNAQWRIRHWDTDSHPWFVENVDMLFFMWYVFELLVRLMTFRLNFFTNSDWYWNVFDMICVFPWQVLTSVAGGGRGGLSFFRVLRMLRMARMLRVIRLMRFFRELRMMMTMLLTSLMTMLWAVVLLCMLFYMFSIVFVNGMVMYLEDGKSDATQDSQLHKHWGGIGRSMLSLYKAMTGGYDWIYIAKDLKALGYMYYSAFIFFIGLMMFGMHNIILGMLCESAHSVSSQDDDKVLAEEKKRADGFITEVSAIFHAIDVEGSNKITWDEFHTLSGNEHVHAFLLWLGIDPKCARQLFTAFAGTSETVDIDAFLTSLGQVKGDSLRSQTLSFERDVLLSIKQTKHFMKWFKAKTTTLHPHCLAHHVAVKPSLHAELSEKSIECAFNSALR